MTSSGFPFKLRPDRKEEMFFWFSIHKLEYLHDILCEIEKKILDSYVQRSARVITYPGLLFLFSFKWQAESKTSIISFASIE